MPYNAVRETAASQSLILRVAACAASEGITDPVGWANRNIWEIASQPGWGDAWQYATDNLTVNQNPDIGARDDVINDAMILSAVQELTGSA